MPRRPDTGHLSAAAPTRTTEFVGFRAKRRLNGRTYPEASKVPGAIRDLTFTRRASLTKAIEKNRKRPGTRPMQAISQRWAFRLEHDRLTLKRICVEIVLPDDVQVARRGEEQALCQACVRRYPVCLVSQFMRMTDLFPPSTPNWPTDWHAVNKTPPESDLSTANWINSLTCRSASGPRTDSHQAAR
jgi:hypothetical protein